MFGLSFRFPAGRYHATPWGRNVNEADVAWPPEPWRILRALVATYWRKGDRERWDRDDLARLVEALAADLPTFRLPEGAVHAHTRHYMPIRKGRAEAPTLVFDAFVHLPTGTEVVAMWPDVSLDDDLLELARNLATGIGYLGRAESWTEVQGCLRAARRAELRPGRVGSFWRPGSRSRAPIRRRLRHRTPTTPATGGTKDPRRVRQGAYGTTAPAEGR